MLRTEDRLSVGERREGLVALGGQQEAFQVATKVITLSPFPEQGIELLAVGFERTRGRKNGRLEAYRLAPADDDLLLLSRYFWNMAICESLYPSRQGLEISLRNSMHGAIAQHIGADDWFEEHHRLLQPRPTRCLPAWGIVGPPAAVEQGIAHS